MALPFFIFTHMSGHCFDRFCELSVCNVLRSQFLVCLRGNLRNVYSKLPSKADTKSLRRSPLQTDSSQKLCNVEPTIYGFII